ncbi:hypothetical protein QTN25_007601 [Entamoeba marina]
MFFNRTAFNKFVDSISNIKDEDVKNSLELLLSLLKDINTKSILKCFGVNDEIMAAYFIHNNNLQKDVEKDIIKSYGITEELLKNSKQCTITSLSEKKFGKNNYDVAYHFGVEQGKQLRRHSSENIGDLIHLEMDYLSKTIPNVSIIENLKDTSEISTNNLAELKIPIKQSLDEQPFTKSNFSLNDRLQWESTHQNDLNENGLLIKITLPNSVETINQKTFGGCKELNSVVLPSNLKEIEKSAFQNCVSLKTIDVPTTVTLLGDKCFKGCTNLLNISLPTSIQKIGSECFSGCPCYSQMKEIYPQL